MAAPARSPAELVNALGTDARWLDDRTLELDLRQGVRFQDGEPFTALDVKQNFEGFSSMLTSCAIMRAATLALVSAASRAGY